MATKRFITPFADTGVKVPVSDIPAGTDVNYETGYTPEYALDPVTDPSARFVEITNENQILNDITGNVKLWQDDNYPEFVTTAKNGGVAHSYNKNVVVRYDGDLYISTEDANDTLPTSAKWIPYLPSEMAKYLELKIFQSPTDGMTEITTRTLLGGEVFEVRKVSDDSLATIYSDASGTTEIAQNGTSNVSGGDGVVKFYIDDGDYYVEVDSIQASFEVYRASTIERIVEYSDAVSEDSQLDTKYNIYGASYQVVSSSDSGGFYLSYTTGKKLKLINSGEVTLFQLGYTNDAGDILNRVVAAEGITSVKSNDVAISWVTQAVITRSLSLDFGRSAITNECNDTSCIHVTTATSTKIKLGFWDGNGKTSLAVTSTPNAVNLQIIDGFGNDFAGQFIETEGARTSLRRVNVTNSQYDASANGAGCIRLKGQRSSINGTTCDGNSGKSISIDASRCAVNDFEIENCLNTGVIGGIGLYVSFAGLNKFTFKSGSVSKSGSHLIKVSGGASKGLIDNIDLYNDSASVSESLENAMCLLSGCNDVVVRGGTCQFSGTLATPIDCYQITVHATPDYSAERNRIEGVTFIDNPSGQMPRLVNILGSSGVNKATDNVISGIRGKGFINLCEFLGDDNNELKNSNITYEGFITVSADNGLGTKILNNGRLENTRDRVGDDFIIRSDGGDDITISGNTLIGKSIGYRGSSSNAWVTRNNFKFPLASSVTGPVRYVYFTAGATGTYSHNDVTESVSNVGEGLVTVNQNVIVGDGTPP